MTTDQHAGTWQEPDHPSGERPLPGGARLLAVPLGPWKATGAAHPILKLIVVSVVIFAATQALPGNAAVAILGHSAAPAQLHALEKQLHLNRSALNQYGSWISGVLSGHPGTSLANGMPVWSIVGPAVANSAVLVGLAGIIGSIVGVALGALAALRKDSLFDQVSSVIALALTALPEFVVAITLIVVLATVVFHVVPAVSLIPPGTRAWDEPSKLILPVLTLVVVIVPYILRMTRAATVEALASDYVEMAQLKGLSTRRVLVVHALPNAVAPVVQVLGLSFLYLAGGIVVVEFVFAYPGIGDSLVSAVSNRDVPVIQMIVLLLAGFYVFVNIVSDVAALLASPRRRLPR
jgi:peptide/nickel transport system permease protein